MLTDWPDDYRPDSPYRPLDWRYRLARELSNGPLLPLLEPFVDDTVRAVAAALAGDQADPSVTAALALAGGPPLDVAELQGRVIADQSDGEIAAAMKLPEDTVATYIAVFFDVVSLLKHRGAVRAIAAGGIDTRAPTPEEAVRWAGFVLGGVMVGVVADYFRRGFGDGRRITGTPGLDSEILKTMRSVRTWLGVLGPPRSPEVCQMRWGAALKKARHEQRTAAAA